MITLRDYQQEAYDAIVRELGAHDSTLLELPTGGGKTEVFAAVAEHWVQGKGRVMVVAPMITLVSQAAKKICRRTGVMPAIEQASLRSNETEWGKCEFVVASKQTLCTKSKKSGRCRFERFRDIGLVVVDECHFAATEQYKGMLDYFRGLGAKVLGVTATPKRHDGRAMGQLFDTCAYQYSILDAMEHGWLVGCKAHCVRIKSMDLSDVKSEKGFVGEKDFKPGELNAILEDEKVCLEIADVTVRESGAMKTAVYCGSVLEAKKVSEIIADRYGIKAAFVCADKRLCPDDRRKEVLDSFTQDPDGIRIVANVGVLSLGWDFPGLEHIVMARPTQSLSMYTQIYGRGTRPLEGTVDFEASTPETRKQRIAQSDKPHFCMTDLVDNSLQHKIVTAIDVLGGKYSLAAVQAAKTQAVDGARMTPEESLAAAQERLRREEEERKERERRRAIRAQTVYAKQEVNPFNQYETGATKVNGRQAYMPFGKHKGKPIRQLSTMYLKTFLEKVESAPQWIRTTMRDELTQRGIGSQSVVLRTGEAIDSQKRTLAKYGKPTDVTYERAVELLREIDQELAERRKARQTA